MLMYTSDFIMNYDKNSDFGYTLLADVDYREYLQAFHQNLPFLPDSLMERPN